MTVSSWSGIVQKLLERPVVGPDGGGIDVLVGAVLAVTADAENDGVDAPLVVEASVRGALVPHGLLECAYLGAAGVGMVRRVGLMDGGRDAGLAEFCQVCGDFLGSLAVQ